MKRLANFFIENGVFAAAGLILAFVAINKADAPTETYPLPTEAKGAYYYSFATGCYQAYLLECRRYDDNEASACYQRGLDYCEVAAKSFKEWIDNGSK